MGTIVGSEKTELRLRYRDFKFRPSRSRIYYPAIPANQTNYNPQQKQVEL